ncbi:hypothetical protein [Actinosynnema sp. NPDC020468]|uniref:hypothetical protein n=1 Tax=Actinosynnema sp. NPDC020468 TaxID=3154488 RepID=UPI0033CEEC82
MRRVVVAVCAVVTTAAGCTAQAQPPADPVKDPATVVRDLVLRDQDTSAKGLTKVGDPVVGTQKLVECPELPSADKAVAGVTAKWTWSHAAEKAEITEYAVVYRDVPGRDVVREARAASTCHRGIGEVESPLQLDEYFYSQDSLGTTKPFVDDRFGYCLWNNPRHRRVCTALQAKGDKVVRVTVDVTGERTDLESIGSATFAQLVTDRLVG